MTAVGDGLALGAAKLRQAEEDLARRDGSEQKKIESKVMILLTDGANNAGTTEPLAAAAMAKEWGIKVYVIGIGAGESFRVVSTPFGDRKIPVGGAFDETALRQVAENTGGRYWPADDAEALRDIYAEIDRLERTTVRTQTFTRHRERFWPFAAVAAVAIVAEMMAGAIVLRRLP
jgi:Ca-activated chloride channel family protein